MNFDVNQPTSPGGSCDTFNSLLRRLDTSDEPPCILIVENVDALADGDKEHETTFDQVMSALSSRGYEMKAVFVDGSEFGVPQRRRRLQSHQLDQLIVH